MQGVHQPALLSGAVVFFHMAYAHRHELGVDGPPQENRSSGSFLGRDAGLSTQTDCRADVVDPRPDPEKLYAETELNARVEEHVSQLPPALQAPFRLYAINGISGPESSKVLGISPNAFKSRIFRARLKLAVGYSRLQIELKLGKFLFAVMWMDRGGE